MSLEWYKRKEKSYDDNRAYNLFIVKMRADHCILIL